MIVRVLRNNKISFDEGLANQPRRSNQSENRQTNKIKILNYFSLLLNLILVSI